MYTESTAIYSSLVSSHIKLNAFVKLRTLSTFVKIGLIHLGFDLKLDVCINFYEVSQEGRDVERVRMLWYCSIPDLINLHLSDYEKSPCLHSIFL